jgi:predicted nuclease of predicted toxin-antitoxin system
MLFLANENSPLSSIVRLRDAGHDVAAIIEDSPGVKDDEVLAKASQEKRILLTFDRDYGELIYKLKYPRPLGVIYFRFFPRTPFEPAELLLSLLLSEAPYTEGSSFLTNSVSFLSFRFFFFISINFMYKA